MDQKNNFDDDASFQEDPPETEEEPDELPPVHSETESAAKSNGRERIGRIKGTGIFDVADGRDPSTKANEEAEIEQLYDEEEITGYCGHCKRPFNAGKPEAKCLACGIVMHQFCLDGHVVKTHRPPAVGVRIVSREGKFFARIKRTEET